MNHVTSELPVVRRRLARYLIPVLLSLGAMGAEEPLAQANAGDEPSARMAALVNRAFPDGVPPQPDGRTLFTTVLDSPQFRHGMLGPFTIYAVGSNADAAATLVGEATRGLAPLRSIPGLLPADEAQGGGIAGPHQSIVLAQTAADYEGVLALLDHCEDLGFSGWKPQNTVWTPEHLEAEVTRTWEVQVFNLQHAVIADRSTDWLTHGLGYYTLAHLVNRAVRLDAWGLSPPWFDQGLIDELDIQAYGKSWVGGEAWVAETEGWFRPGWSGFLPQGMAPPEEPSGPPKDLATKVTKTGDPWDDRTRSAERHWTELVDDRRSAAPASFAYMAQHQSFLPRDRAYTRCALHLMLALGQSGDIGPGLLTRLGRTAAVGEDGMPDSDPLTAIVSASLGGVPDVDRLEALPLADLLVEIKRPDLSARITELKADGLLALNDHRAQSGWLYDEWEGELEDRGELFRLIMEAEQAQQLYEWPLIGDYLDRGMAGALAASPTFPATDADAAKVVAAFRTGFTQEIKPPEPAPPEKPTKKSPAKKKGGKASDGTPTSPRG